MARINTNIASFIARTNLNRSNEDLQVHLQRLSTGLKINRGKDDPAGLIISERLRTEIAGLNQAVDNSSRASSVIATTEGSLAEVNDLLTSIQSLVVQSANTGALSDAERAANQLQIDSAIDTITRISNSASFGGLKLLNGELDYVLSGLSSSAIPKAQISAANFAGQSSIQVNVDVVASAQTGNLYLSASTGAFVSTTTLEIAGPLGVQTVTILSTTSIANVIAAINNFKAATGVSAQMINLSNAASGMVFSSAGFGSHSFVSVRRLDGPPGGGSIQTMALTNNYPNPGPGGFSFSNPVLFANCSVSNRDTGRDVQAIVNGALVSGDGLKISLQDPNLSMQLLLDQSFATVNNSTTSFDITGGGALYQLGGQINNSQQVNIGVQSVAASRLGGTLIGSTVEYLSSLKSGGFNDLNSRNFENASNILASSTSEVAVQRGRLGAFERNTLDTNVRALQAAIENLSSSESRIRDTDFAEETAALSRAQVLASTGTSVLTIANQQAQQVLQLLR